MKVFASLMRKGNGAQVIGQILQNIVGPTVVKVGFPAGKTPGDIMARAVWNEFGTSRGIPERPFFRNAMRDNKASYRALAVAYGKPVLLGQMKTTTALSRIGLKAQGDIQRSIVALKSPPNAASTIAQKGSSNPLIDTGEMRQRVTFEIET